MARARLAVLLALPLLSCSRDLSVPGGTPPVLGLVSPCLNGVSSPCQDNAVVSGDVTVQVKRTGGGSLGAVELWTPGIAVTTLTAPPWSWLLHSRTLYPVGGVMPVYVTPIDTQGVRASPVQFSLIVDNAGPDVAIVSPAHDTSWPMTLPVTVTVCASDVQGVASVTAVIGQVQAPLAPSGTCADGRRQYGGAIAAPGGGVNTLRFDLVVQAADARGNVSNTYVPLVATRQRWARAMHSPAAFYGGATAPVPQSVQHAFRAYAGGVILQTASGNGGYIHWTSADGTAAATMDPSIARYAFAPYGDGQLAVLSSASPAAIQLYQVVAGTPTLVTSNTSADWGGIGELVGFGDQVACFASDQNNVNPLFKRMACFNHSGSTRFSWALNQHPFDVSALTVAGDWVLVVRQPSGGCGIQIDRYSPLGLLQTGACVATRPVRPYVHGDAYGAVVLGGVAAHVDPSGNLTDLGGLTSTLGSLLARGPGGALVWAAGDSILLRTVVTVTDAAGNVTGSTVLPYDARPALGWSPGGFDSVQSDAAGFDASGHAFLLLRELAGTGTVFHVVSVDGTGALRWDYTTTPTLALTLAPAQTSEPLYVVHDDGLVEALVR